MTPAQKSLISQFTQTELLEAHTWGGEKMDEGGSRFGQSEEARY